MKGHSILRSNKTTIELVQLYIKWILIMHYVNTKNMHYKNTKKCNSCLNQ